MIKFRNLKSILLTTGLTLGLSLSISSSAFASTYAVTNGDSFYKIGQILNTTVASLVVNNNFLSTYTNSIQIGQKLHIPIKLTTTSDTVTDITYTKHAKYSSEDLDLLSRLITAEAQGESYNAKVAVGAVVLNRVKDNSFPNSISEVINQNINGYYQFTPVLNGWINKPAKADCIEAAKEVLNGTDPTNGALFFFDNTITNTWLLSRPVSITVDNMIFAH